MVGDVARMSAGLSAQAATAAADAYEPDDTMGAARDLGSASRFLAQLGEAAFTEARTLHAASGSGGGAAWNEDWYTFTVTADDIRYGFFEEGGVGLLIEAWTKNPVVDTVVEVYREGATPTDPRLLPDLSGPEGVPDGYTDTDPASFASNDEEFWFANSGSSVPFLLDPDEFGTLAGRYYVRVRPYYQGDFPDRPAGVPVGFADGAGAYEFRVKLGMAQRLSGASRYETAVRISRERYPDAFCDGWWVTVASGRGFADALAGSTLAGAAGGPLLLTDRYALPGAVRDEIARLASSDPAGDQGPTTVLLLGGPGAVDEAVVTAISAIPDVVVERVYGANRHATAAAVAYKAQEVLAEVAVRTGLSNDGVAKLAFLTSARRFPDALAASPMAAFNAAPILLTDPSSLSAATADALRDPSLGITDVVIVGGTLAVGSAAEAQVKAIVGSSRVKRVQGGSRYATARAFAEWASDLDGIPVGTDSPSSALLVPLYPESVGLASGASFADALSGGVVCGQAGFPLLLNDLALFPSAVYGYLEDAENCPGQYFLKSYAFGGARALPDDDLLFFDTLTLPWWTH